MNNPNKLNIDLNSIDNVKCDECDSDVFSPAFIIKKISALMAPSGKETLMPIQLFKCGICGHINELFLEGLTN